MFLDENRSPVGHLKIGPWEGTFAWRRVTGRIRVPPHAREGIVNIGLLGATGEVSYDDIRILPPKAKKGAREEVQAEE